MPSQSQPSALTDTREPRKGEEVKILLDSESDFLKVKELLEQNYLRTIVQHNVFFDNEEQTLEGAVWQLRLRTQHNSGDECDQCSRSEEDCCGARSNNSKIRLELKDCTKLIKGKQYSSSIRVEIPTSLSDKLMTTDDILKVLEDFVKENPGSSSQGIESIVTLVKKIIMDMLEEELKQEQKRRLIARSLSQDSRYAEVIEQPIVSQEAVLHVTRSAERETGGRDATEINRGRVRRTREHSEAHDNPGVGNRTWLARRRVEADDGNGLLNQPEGGSDSDTENTLIPRVATPRSPVPRRDFASCSSLYGHDKAHDEVLRCSPHARGGTPASSESGENLNPVATPGSRGVSQEGQRRLATALKLRRVQHFTTCRHEFLYTLSQQPLNHSDSRRGSCGSQSSHDGLVGNEMVLRLDRTMFGGIVDYELEVTPIHYELDIVLQECEQWLTMIGVEYRRSSGSKLTRSLLEKRKQEARQVNKKAIKLLLTRAEGFEAVKNAFLSDDSNTFLFQRSTGVMQSSVVPSKDKNFEFQLFNDWYFDGRSYELEQRSCSFRLRKKNHGEDYVLTVKWNISCVHGSQKYRELSFSMSPEDAKRLLECPASYFVDIKHSNQVLMKELNISRLVLGSLLQIGTRRWVFEWHFPRLQSLNPLQIQLDESWRADSAYLNSQQPMGDSPQSSGCGVAEGCDSAPKAGAKYFLEVTNFVAGSDDVQKAIEDILRSLGVEWNVANMSKAQQFLACAGSDMSEYGAGPVP